MQNSGRSLKGYSARQLETQKVVRALEPARGARFTGKQRDTIWSRLTFLQNYMAVSNSTIFFRRGIRFREPG